MKKGIGKPLGGEKSGGGIEQGIRSQEADEEARQLSVARRPLQVASEGIRSGPPVTPRSSKPAGGRPAGHAGLGRRRGNARDRLKPPGQGDNRGKQRARVRTSKRTKCHCQRRPSFGRNDLSRNSRTPAHRNAAPPYPPRTRVVQGGPRTLERVRLCGRRKDEENLTNCRSGFQRGIPAFHPQQLGRRQQGRVYPCSGDARS